MTVISSQGGLLSLGDWSCLHTMLKVKEADKKNKNMQDIYNKETKTTGASLPNKCKTMYPLCKEAPLTTGAT